MVNKISALWNEHELELLKKNYECTTIDYMLTILPYRTRDSIKLKANKIGLKSNYFWNEKEIHFLLENYQKFGTAYCANILKKSYKSIAKQVHNLDLGGVRNDMGRIKHPSYYKVNSNYFTTIEMPEVAYILGLLWADGYISNGRIGLTCIKSDIDEIKWIFDKTGIWNYNTFKKKENWQEMAVLDTTNPYLYDFLVKNDYIIKSGASADKILNNIPKHLHHYFFLGYSDGDACFYVNLKNQCFQYTISSCYDQNWIFITHLYEELNLTKYKIYQRARINENNKLAKNSSIRMSNYKQIVILGNFLYNNYQENNIGFSRKYFKYLTIKNKELI